MKSILTVIGLLAVTGCSPGGEQDEAAVRRVVTEFGRQLQQVSLTADPEIARQAIREHYGAFVSPRLLQKWTQNPALAPGRVTSSPWPDRIEIDSVVSETSNRYRVKGRVMEVTSILSSGSPGRPQPVELTVERQNREWLISEVSGEGMVTEVPQDTVPELSPDSDVAQAVAVLQAYYEAINARKYSSAYALWGSGGEASGQDYFDFMDGFAGTRSVELITDQPGSIEGAAGSRYIEIPVRIRAELWGGLKQRLAGTYTLRRSMVDGATDEEQQWRIYKAHIEEKD